VRVTDDFLPPSRTDGDWNLTAAPTARSMKTLKARDLWEKIGYAAWASADPGMQFTPPSTTGTPARRRPIRASNPCSEYMFLDDTACNLASLNLLQFRNASDGSSTSRLRARLPAVDRRARNLGADGAVPVARRSPSSPTSTARSASATPISAAC
jgi:ribonucleotide reductase alpha subunit